MNEFISEEELSERLQVSRNTLWKLRKKGMPHTRVGKKIRYNHEDAINWLKENGGK